MISRQTQTVQIRTFVQEQDSYGQLRQKGYTDADAEMYVALASDTQNTDPTYSTEDFTGLTKAEVTTQNEVIIGGVPHLVVRVNKSPRWNVVTLRRH